jgi:tetratricopeptide (TPR) repeat protein
MRATLFIIASIVILLAGTLAAQTDGERKHARELAMNAITIVDQGELDEGLKMLQEASKLDPTVSDYVYEQGYIYEIKGEYARAKEIVEPLLARADATDRFYQLVGNSYDYLKDPEKAIKTYYAGLKRFPNSGELHLELGIMAMGQEDYNKALHIWEEGIDRDPMHSSNYYWAAKFLCNSDHRLWGVIYAEIFINLEPATKRTKEISKLLFDTYNRSITLKGDTSKIDFEPGIYVRVGENGKPVLPLIASYSPAFLLALPAAAAASPADSTLTLADLHGIRSRFIANWFTMKNNKKFPSVLFDLNRRLADKGHGEAYDYWLLSHGNPDEFIAWHEKHEKELTSMIEGLLAAPLRIDSATAFNRVRVDMREN